MCRSTLVKIEQVFYHSSCLTEVGPIMAKRKLIALSYRRVATDDQGDRDVFAPQQAVIDKTIEKMGYRKGAVFSDVISGSTAWVERPGMKALLKKLASGDRGTYVVVASSHDRYSRNAGEYQKMKAALGKHGAEAVDAHNVSDPQAQKTFMEAVEGYVSSVTRANLVRRLQAGKAAAKARRK
jgi:DNA invertase Pin-like site-specific DNA recombinase